MLPSIERTEPARTVIVPRVAPPARSPLRVLLTWVVFGAVAVAVVAGTTLWSVALRTSAASRTTPEPSGIGTAATPAAVAALPTTPAAATPTTQAVVTAAHRQRAAAPPPAPRRTVADAPSALTPAAPTTLPGPVACVGCATSAPVSQTQDRKDASTTVPESET